MRFAFLPGLGPMELTILLVLGVLLFGRRLPDVVRYLEENPEARLRAAIAFLLITCLLLLLSLITSGRKRSAS